MNWLGAGIESLKEKLTACTREKLNLQEELSEAYRIKGQLADLHAAEVSKNMEAEKQVKFFQGCVPSAFVERDHSIMEVTTFSPLKVSMFCLVHRRSRRTQLTIHQLTTVAEMLKVIAHICGF
ncbi:uncharacterized protein LOC114272304 [Camellia sinensis]|uniref:uncharacterized protein LOC114272304 n=1 Tax=Camellia sinensis TaxID=4442 RepID=UPI001035D223|nr:uncharacterized protein LOC114272304 [Camellia sinensis]